MCTAFPHPCVSRALENESRALFSSAIEPRVFRSVFEPRFRQKSTWNVTSAKKKVYASWIKGLQSLISFIRTRRDHILPSQSSRDYFGRRAHGNGVDQCHAQPRAQSCAYARIMFSLPVARTHTPVCRRDGMSCHAEASVVDRLMRCWQESKRCSKSKVFQKQAVSRSFSFSTSILR
jgi:hypothetical protein